jgi:O-antigen ligase
MQGPLDAVSGDATPAPRRRSRKSTREINAGAHAAPNRIASYIFFFVLAAAPFPFGSSNPPAIAFWCGTLALALVFASPRDLKALHAALLGGIALLIVAYVVVLHEQLSEAPWFAKPDPIWARASQLLDTPLKGVASVVRGEPFYALGAPLAFLLALTLGIVIGTDRLRSRQTVQVIAWSGVAYAIYGILSLFFEPNMLLWREKTAYLGNLTGTFINRNTAAAYFGSCSLVWLLLLLMRIRDRLPKGPIAWKKVPERVLTDPPRDMLVRFGMFFICLVAMFMTNSRAGVTVSIVAMVSVFVLFFRRDLPGWRNLAVALAAATAFGLILLELIGGNVSYRFDVQGLADAGRMEAYRSTWRIIMDHPWFGTGLGTFAAIFPIYRSDNISMYGVWDIAHSTPLEFAAELGLPLTALVGVAWLIALFVLVRAVQGRRRRAMVPMAALMVCAIALSHSLIDFSLQIAGYAIVVFGLLGVGLAQSVRDEADRPPPPSSRSAVDLR